MVLVKHFHLAEMHQSPNREEILLVVHWAVDIRTITVINSCVSHAIIFHFKCVWRQTCGSEGAGRNSPPNRSIICSSATSLVGVTLGGGGTFGPFLN